MEHSSQQQHFFIFGAVGGQATAGHIHISLVAELHTMAGIEGLQQQHSLPPTGSMDVGIAVTVAARTRMVEMARPEKIILNRTIEMFV